MLLDDGYDPIHICQVKRLILATSFGQSNPESPHFRAYKPETLPEKVLAFADIAGFMKDFEGWMEENLCVLQEADPETVRDMSFEQWLAGRQNFLAYCRLKLNELEVYLGQQYFKQMHTQIDGHVARLADGAEIYRDRFCAIRDKAI